ncbi:unnamed protein product [Amoebophrya sp. A25]|nr:unnamed protein product [Amoebophrya sp. A25]|eukprot:GSA25T00005108001.1
MVRLDSGASSSGAALGACFPSCSAGQRWSGSACVACPANTYMSNKDWLQLLDESPHVNWAGKRSHGCMSCPPGTESAQGATSIEHCVEPAETILEFSLPPPLQSFDHQGGTVTVPLSMDQNLYQQGGEEDPLTTAVSSSETGLTVDEKLALENALVVLLGGRRASPPSASGTTSARNPYIAPSSTNSRRTIASGSTELAWLDNIEGNSKMDPSPLDPILHELTFRAVAGGHARSDRRAAVRIRGSSRVSRRSPASSGGRPSVSHATALSALQNVKVMLPEDAFFAEESDASGAASLLEAESRRDLAQAGVEHASMKEQSFTKSKKRRRSYSLGSLRVRAYCKPGFGRGSVGDEHFLCEACPENSFSRGGFGAICSACAANEAALPGSSTCHMSCLPGFGAIFARSSDRASTSRKTSFSSSSTRRGDNVEHVQNDFHLQGNQEAANHLSESSFVDRSTSSTSGPAAEQLQGGSIVRVNCAYCGADHFAGGGLEQCVSCPKSRPLATAGSSKPSHCRKPCPSGQGWNGSGCHTCAHGTTAVDGECLPVMDISQRTESAAIHPNAPTAPSLAAIDIDIETSKAHPGDYHDFLLEGDKSVEEGRSVRDQVIRAASQSGLSPANIASIKKRARGQISGAEERQRAIKAMSHHVDDAPRENADPAKSLSFSSLGATYYAR